MWTTSNATRLSPETSGLLLGVLGVLGFSLTLPATKAAVADLDATVVGLGRAVIPSVLAAAMLLASSSRIPRRGLWPRLVLVAAGVVIGFPLFTALALQNLTAAHGAVITGLLPAATAVFAVVLGGERPSPMFWLVCIAGLASVLGFAASQGAGRPQAADILALMAVLSAALGYSQGAIAAREIGGWRVICWALLLAAPLVVPVVAVTIARTGLTAGGSAWVGFLYVSLISMFLAFFAWYRGLALGGVARVSQVQLAQPVLTFVWSVLLLGERLGGATVIAGALVLVCAVASQRTRVRRAPSKPEVPHLHVAPARTMLP